MRAHNLQGTLALLHQDLVASQLIAQLLDAVKVEVISFQDPRLLLAAIHEVRPECLLVDFILPEMSCFQVTSELRRQGCLAPVIFMSNRVDQNMLVRAMNHGAYGFLSRPFQQIELLESVQAAISRYREQKPYFDIYVLHRSLLAELSPRELQIYDHMIAGRSARQTSEKLGISYRTVEHHRARLLEKLEVSGSLELSRRHGVYESVEVLRASSDSLS